MTPYQFIHALGAILDDWDEVGQYNHHTDGNTYMTQIQALWKRYQETIQIGDPR